VRARARVTAGLYVGKIDDASDGDLLAVINHFAPFATHQRLRGDASQALTARAQSSAKEIVTGLKASICFGAKS